MLLPTEPIGSIPRPLPLIRAAAASNGIDPKLDALCGEAVRDTIERFEATGSPVVTDGEQRKFHNFWTYCVHGLANTAPDGFQIPFAAGHVRRMLRLTSGPFRYGNRADRHLKLALRYATRPVKQAVILPSALSLMYPAEPLPNYPREQFIEDLLSEHPPCQRERGPRLPRHGRAQGADRLHRRAFGPQDRAGGPAPAQLHRPEQQGPGALLGPGPQVDRRAHVPGWRPRLDAQR